MKDSRKRARQIYVSLRVILAFCCFLELSAFVPRIAFLRNPPSCTVNTCGWSTFMSTENNKNEEENRKSAPSSFEQNVADTATGKLNSATSDIIAAAAAITQDSCELLGIKSIGVDYGLVRTGLALTVGYNPTPLTILSNLNSTEVAQQVVKYSAAEQVKKIIVGLPLHKNGTEANQTTITRTFASELAYHALSKLGPNVPVLLFDERYTSKEAAARLHSQNPNSNLQGMLDADAACIILENYYNDNGENAQPVIVPDEVRAECLSSWESIKANEDNRLQSIQNQRETNMNKRQEAMERARKLEAEGKVLGTSNKKKKKKKKKKREKRVWTTL
mmetsp:Transcript_17301/g.26775  ORF Transcript_17301/g.26775 Transcript_17301/m.26775 type:complete len:333 (-) Transcript_17301:137-1135(-)